MDFASIEFGRGPVQSTGFDPEIFLVKPDGKMLPAFEFLPGKNEQLSYMPTVNDPSLTIEGLEPGAYWDGFQAEFSTMPFLCHGWAVDQVAAGLGVVLKAARKVFPKAKFTLQNVFEFTQEELWAYEPMYVELGCCPSMNAYNTRPFQIDNPFELPYRMAGGHIHLGLKGLHEVEAVQMAKYLDLIVGIPSVGMFAEIDNPVRRKYYGRAGEFRLPSHGLEYRTLSNAWLGHPAVCNVLIDLARMAVGAIRQKVSFDDLGTSPEAVRDIIDSTDVKAARKLYKEAKPFWNDLLKRMYYRTDQSSPLFHKMVEHSVEEVIPDYRNIETNWKLPKGLYHSIGPESDSSTTWLGLTRSVSV